MQGNSSVPVKVVFTLAKTRRPLRLVEIANETGLTKSHVNYHLKRLIEDNIVIRDGDRYACQPFFFKKETKDDLSALARVLISLLTKELIVDRDATEEELGEQILRNTEMFLRLYKEGLFS